MKEKTTRSQISETHVREAAYHEPKVYEIRIKGHLDERWAGRFEALIFTYESDGTTMLRGPLSDQAALHGVFNGIRDLGLTIVSVQLVNP